MKPRKNWTIADGAASARRTDGVVAAFVFSHHEQPYAVYRHFQGERGRQQEWLSAGRTPGTARRFRTLDKAMDAADKVWPCKTN